MRARRNFHSHFRWIDHHVRVSRLDRVEKVGATLEQRKQTVFGMKIFRVGNFDCSRPRRSDVEISNRQPGKDISFGPKIELQILFGEAMNSEPVNRAEQDRLMENQQQGKKDGKRNPNATPPFSLWFGIFFLVIFHEHFTLWIALERANGRAEQASACSGTRGARPSVTQLANEELKLVSSSADLGGLDFCRSYCSFHSKKSA